MANIDHTKLDAIQAIRTLQPFVGTRQLFAIASTCRSEEKQFFFDKLVELADLVSAMPETYEQDGLGQQAVAYLHYFVGGNDWYITERDCDPDGDGQSQAFGLARMNGGYPELGYISIRELIKNHVELDLYFEPKPLSQIGD
jgi:hypothetical protein